MTFLYFWFQYLQIQIALSNLRLFDGGNPLELQIIDYGIDAERLPQLMHPRDLQMALAMPSYLDALSVAILQVSRMLRIDGQVFRFL